MNTVYIYQYCGGRETSTYEPYGSLLAELERAHREQIWRSFYTTGIDHYARWIASRSGTCQWSKLHEALARGVDTISLSDDDHLIVITTNKAMFDAAKNNNDVFMNNTYDLMKLF